MRLVRRVELNFKFTLALRAHLFVRRVCLKEEVVDRNSKWRDDLVKSIPWVLIE